MAFSCSIAEGLFIVPVVSYNDIEKKIEDGTTNRTVAATNMNATSRYFFVFCRWLLDRFAI